MKLPTKEELHETWIRYPGTTIEFLYEKLSKYVALAEREALERLLERLRKHAESFGFPDSRTHAFTFQGGICSAIRKVQGELDALLPAAPTTEQETATTAPRAAGSETRVDEERGSSASPVTDPRRSVSAAGSQPSSSPPLSTCVHGFPFGAPCSMCRGPSALTEADVRRIAREEMMAAVEQLRGVR